MHSRQVLSILPEFDGENGRLSEKLPFEARVDELVDVIAGCLHESLDECAVVVHPGLRVGHPEELRVAHHLCAVLGCHLQRVRC